MKFRVISLLLAVVMLLVLIPAPANVSAVATTPDEIIQQLRTIYRRCKSGSGMSSFNGYCGSMVSWQSYLLGIDAKLSLGDGNEQFDRYRDLDKTSGGYSVKNYPATKYTLTEAMNAITHNGTQDVYNMIVGFQKTNTAAGQKYGHAVYVQAIIEGKVYFIECYNATIGGTYYSEGTPITCTIEEFCKYYDRWTVFEGISYFGLRTYADICTRYPSAMKAMAMADGYIYKEPGDPGIHDAARVAKLYSGQWLAVSGLLVTPNGNLWYEVEFDGRTRYVEADKLSMGSVDTSMLTLTGLSAPTALRKGNGFTLTGTISTQNSTIRKVTAVVYPMDETAEPIFSAAMNVNAKTVSLKNTQFNNALTFRKLEAGEYRLSLIVELEIYVVEDGQLATKTAQVDLYDSRFLIKTDSATYPIVKFDGNGGTTELDQLVVVKNATVGSLPTAERSGYAFAGWTLDKAGTKPVAPETIITKNITLYAQWVPGHSGSGGWQETEDGWHYCAGDSPVEGWIEFGDLKFYQYSDGTLAKGWVMIDQNLRYFNAAGALITRLEGPSGTSFDAQTDGTGTLGWLATGSVPLGSPLTPEEVAQRQEEMENMPAAGRVMQTLSASIYYLAVKITSGELPQEIQEVLD